MEYDLLIFCFFTTLATVICVRWDELAVKWERGVFTLPVKLPRTTKDATTAGWTKVGSGTCGGSNNYQGIAYSLNNDYSITILYDIKGYIAGVQAGITLEEAQASGFPSTSQMTPFVLDGDVNNRYVISVYFTLDPYTICSKGRTGKQFLEEGTGTDLLLQSGNDTFTTVPNSEIDVETPWVAGRCYITKGHYYWNNHRNDMDCAEFFPLYLIYNDRDLSGFGWAFTANLKGEYYEHPTRQDYSRIMKSVPECLNETGTLSMMHFYLEPNPGQNFC